MIKWLGAIQDFNSAVIILLIINNAKSIDQKK